MFFNIYGHGGHLVQLRGTICTNWQYPFDRRSNVKSGKIAQTVSEKKTFKNYTIFLHVYSIGARADNPLGTKF